MDNENKIPDPQNSEQKPIDIKPEEAIPEEIKQEEAIPEEIKQVSPATPPELPEELKIESEWAEKLGMDYKPEQFVSETENATPESVSSVPPAALYVMPTNEPLGNCETSSGKGEPMPPTCLVWAILSTICCCMPAGIVAIIFSMQVSSRYYARDYEGARKASDKAQAWIIASIVLGIIGNAIYMPLSMLSGAMGM